MLNCVLTRVGTVALRRETGWGFGLMDGPTIFDGKTSATAFGLKVLLLQGSFA
jgi:hypothetical protein